MSDHETGPEFEERARNVARAIHDPLGVQGAVIFNRLEYDAVFQSDEAINAYEFTTDRKKEKAEKDSKKLNELLVHLQRQPQNRYRSCAGWFVTKDEPTADQRGAVERESRRTGMPLHAISIISLQRRLCDAEGYLRCRDQAPFGSTAYSTSDDFPKAKAEPEFSWSLTSLSVKEVCAKLLNGERAILTGEFGVGKSYAMRELYRELRKEYLKSSGALPFPLHINLRDCAGLRTPAEILRRHAEEIGFAGERSLISAWRAGSCILLLDGFDEIVPTRWLGSASDLRQVRWQSLTPIRRIVEEAPAAAGIAVCGRPHFFSSANEMHDALGFNLAVPAYIIEDFSERQLKQFLANSDVSSHLPEWLPARPLLIGYLIATKSLGQISSGKQLDQADAWRELFSLICRREAEILTAVRPETIKNIISRVATLARARGDELGPIGMGQMERAFVDVNGVQPDEEGIQLLLRLPGLATMDSSESRVFVDRNVADTAYGEDLSSYIASPYEGHPLAQSASWVTAANQLGVDVASRSLAEIGITSGAALAAAKKRQGENRFDAVLADTIRVTDALHPAVTRDSYLVEGVIFEYLAPDDGHTTLARTTLQDCVIDVLDIGNLDDVDDCPQFQSCLIGYLDGATSIPQWLIPKFNDCAIERYSDHLSTTAGIMQLKFPNEKRVALTILKKIYSQRGSGRKESALSRGLDQQSRAIVPAVLSALVSDGWVWRSAGRSEPIYLPVKGRRADALRVLDKPGDFRLKA